MTVTYKGRCNVPKDDCHGQGNNVPYALCKIHQKEEVAHKAQNQRSHIEPIAPVLVRACGDGIEIVAEPMGKGR